MSTSNKPMKAHMLGKKHDGIYTEATFLLTSQKEKFAKRLAGGNFARRTPVATATKH